MAAASLALQSLIPGSAARQRSYVSTQLSGRGQTPALCRKYVRPEAALLLNSRRPALLCDRALLGGCCMLAGTAMLISGLRAGQECYRGGAWFC